MVGAWRHPERGAGGSRDPNLWDSNLTGIQNIWGHTYLPPCTPITLDPQRVCLDPQIPLMAQEVWVGGVDPSPNAKYISRYEAEIAANPAALRGHHGMVAALGARVRAVSGYELDIPFQRYSHPPVRGIEWWRAWLGDPTDEETLRTLLAVSDPPRVY
mmetsp:Transcript_7658/g.17133  ORF Transcript_7658/g.17133 Transcript_7658/m.17133 type:complete len:158 (+) Transcript_7658:1125-1598(+)